jgi:hypothetical protein
MIDPTNEALYPSEAKSSGAGWVPPFSLTPSTKEADLALLICHDIRLITNAHGELNRAGPRGSNVPINSIDSAGYPNVIDERNMHLIQKHRSALPTMVSSASG